MRTKTLGKTVIRNRRHHWDYPSPKIGKIGGQTQKTPSVAAVSEKNDVNSENYNKISENSIVVSENDITILKNNLAVSENYTEVLNRDLDKEYLTRALSHDVSAHLMVLEYSFRRYDQLVKQMTSTESEPERKIIRPHEDRTARNFDNNNAADIEQETLIRESSEHVSACLCEMKRFVDELIAFAKTGSIDMEPSSVSVGETVCEVLFEQQQLLNSRRIEVTIASSLPTVWANRLRVKQILTNLVRNAAIHGCDEILPRLMITSDFSPNSEIASFCVSDNGRGIPESERTRIFEPGYRVPGNQNEGSGIGLAIVKKIASYYGGDILCGEDVNGTTFRVFLPKGK